MDASYVYWFTRIGALESFINLLIIPSIVYLTGYGIYKFINCLEDGDTPDSLKKAFTAKHAILFAVAFVLLVIISEMVPSKQDLRMMLAVDLATNHGINVLVEK